MSIQRLINKVGVFSLELTNICNLNCDFCANKFMTREKGQMDLGLAKRLIREVKDTKFCDEIILCVMGDPLLYKGLFALLKYADELNQNIILITNGEKLDENVSAKLLAYPPSLIAISYHSSNESSYRHKHSPFTYEQYKKRVFDLIELKFRLNVKTHIDISVISTFNMPQDKFKILDNKQDLDLFKKEWLAFAKFIKGKYRVSWGVPSSIYPGANMLLPDFCISLYFFYHSWANSILPSGTRVIPSQKCSCPRPFTQFNVLWNGDLTFCCTDYNGNLVFDNIKDKSIVEAFNSDKITKIRRNFLKGENIPQKCSSCYGKIVNMDGSDYNFTKRFYKLSKLDNSKRYYLRIHRFLWKIATSRFNYKKLVLYSKIRRWFIIKYCAISYLLRKD